jgi:dCMP deaminase
MSPVEWDRRFMEIAFVASKWSKDLNAKVGAVVVDAQGQVAGVGYNGFPKKVDDSLTRLQSDIKLELVVHAEVNAILGAGDRARGGTLYVSGKPICARCAGLIIQAGIDRVVASEPQASTGSKWDESGLIARQMFQEAQLKIASPPSG